MNLYMFYSQGFIDGDIDIKGYILIRTSNQTKGRYYEDNRNPNEPIKRIYFDNPTTPYSRGYAGYNQYNLVNIHYPLGSEPPEWELDQGEYSDTPNGSTSDAYMTGNRQYFSESELNPRGGLVKYLVLDIISS